MLIGAVCFVVCLGICFSFALHLRSRSRLVDAQKLESARRSHRILQTVRHAEQSRVAAIGLRKAIGRYVASIESRPSVPWATVVTELSRLRPSGAWAERLSGNGPRFKVTLRTAAPDLAPVYVEQLRESPYIEFVSLAGGDARSRQVTGRTMGE